MLWSLIKVLIFVALIGAITFGAGMLMETQGQVVVEFAGYEMVLGPIQVVIVLLVFIFALWLTFQAIGLFMAVLRFINGDETAFSRYFDRSRERRGFDALVESLTAQAAGEGREALAKATKAERLLKRPEITTLVVAKAAELAGDTQKAKNSYRRLLTDKRTQFVGVQGLLQQKLAEGDTETAMVLAQKAFALKPKHLAAQDSLLRLQTDTRDWAGMRETFAAKLKHGTMPRDLHRRRDGVMTLAQAIELNAAGEVEKAQEFILEANRLSPDLIPATEMAMRTYIDQEKPKLATKLALQSWANEPHPDIAAAFAAIVPDEAPSDRLKRFARLIKQNPDHAESKMLLAELHIGNADLASARDAIGDLATVDPTVRSLTIMAAIERGEGAPDQHIRERLTQALSAQRDPAWTCENCGEIHAEWAPVCNSCAAIDSLSWKRPGQSDSIPSQSAGMLPLIVGQEEDEELLLPEDGAVVLPAPGQG